MRVLITGAVCCAVATVAMAQTYPSKAIRVVVPFAAGSATDTVGRSYTAKFKIGRAHV